MKINRQMPHKGGQTSRILSTFRTVVPFLRGQRSGMLPTFGTVYPIFRGSNLQNEGVKGFRNRGVKGGRNIHLRNKGYKYLALEALSKNHKINTRGYPCFQDGFYIKEPIFGEMLREAVKLGFTLVDYESNQKCNGKGKDKYYCQRFRDSLQAINIYNIKKKDANAKILVLAGYSHIKENNEYQKKKMAEYFNEISGINPITIDQTIMMDFGEKEMNNSYYNYIVDEIVNEPVILKNNESVWSHSDQLDISVFSPRLRKENNRYSFYAVSSKKSFLPKAKCRNAHFIQAFYKKEKGDNIPADQIILDSKQKYLYLYSGVYVIYVYDKNGKFLKKYRTRIK